MQSCNKRVKEFRKFLCTKVADEQSIKDVMQADENHKGELRDIAVQLCEKRVKVYANISGELVKASQTKGREGLQTFALYLSSNKNKEFGGIYTLAEKKLYEIFPELNPSD